MHTPQTPLTYSQVPCKRSASLLANPSQLWKLPPSCWKRSGNVAWRKASHEHYCWSFLAVLSPPFRLVVVFLDLGERYSDCRIQDASNGCFDVWELGVIAPVKVPVNHWHCLLIDRPVFNNFVLLLGLCGLPPINKKCLIVCFHCWFGIPGYPKDPKCVRFCYWYYCWMTLKHFNVLPKQQLIIGVFLFSCLFLLMQTWTSNPAFQQVSASDSASPDAEKLAQEAKQQFSSLGDKTGEALATWTTIVTE